MALWRQYQALSLELLALEGRVADCRKDLTATAKDIYELYQTSDEALDGPEAAEPRGERTAAGPVPPAPASEICPRPPSPRPGP